MCSGRWAKGSSTVPRGNIGRRRAGICGAYGPGSHRARCPEAPPPPPAPTIAAVSTRPDMRYVVCIPDGAADEPLAELGGRTPLEAAAMPHLARLAAAGEVGKAAVIPPGLPPGSDVGNMAILGYDPARYHTGRAPIEAAAMGIDLQPGQVAYRCNLVTLDDATGTMVDFSAHHIATELSTPIIEAVDAELGGGRDGVSFYPGVMYR